MLTNGPTERISETDLVISTGEKIYTNQRTVPAQSSANHLTISTDYRRHQEDRFEPMENLPIPRISVIQRGQNKVKIETQGESINLKSGEETTITGQESRAKISGTGEMISVVPNVSVLNRGEVRVFGGQGVQVLPLETDDVYADDRARTLSRRRNSQVKDKMVVVHEGGENNGN